MAKRIQPRRLSKSYKTKKSSGHSHVLQQSQLRSSQLPPPPECPAGLLYTVRRSDTLARIERELGVWIDDILDANPQLDDSDTLLEGQQICIPFVEPEPCPSGFVVEVIEGDTLHSIAREFGVDVEELIDLNPHLANPERILPGFRLCMPEEALSQDRQVQSRSNKKRARREESRVGPRVYQSAIPYPRIF